MNKEIPKPNTEDIEEGMDLYDGMFLSALDDVEYIDSLNSFSLKELKKRLEEYYVIVDGYDAEKKETLIKKFGEFIDKKVFTAVINHIDFMLIKLEGGLDMFDTTILYIMNHHSVIDVLKNNQLYIIKNRLEEYCKILEGQNQSEKDEFFGKFGDKLNLDKMGDLIALIEMSLERDNV